MKFFLAHLFLLSGFSLFSQGKVEGKVLDSITNTPITGTSIYLDNTQVGATTNSEGLFSLIDLPEGAQLLVISSVGYKTRAVEIGRTNISDTSLTIKMSREVPLLEDVTIITKSFSSVSSKKWKNIFKELGIYA